MQAAVYAGEAKERQEQYKGQPRGSSGTPDRLLECCQRGRGDSDGDIDRAAAEGDGGGIKACRKPRGQTGEGEVDGAVICAAGGCKVNVTLVLWPGNRSRFGRAAGFN